MKSLPFMRVSFHLLPHCWGFLALPHGSCKCGQFLKKNLETLKSIEGILILNISTKDSLGQALWTGVLHVTILHGISGHWRGKCTGIRSFFDLTLLLPRIEKEILQNDCWNLSFTHGGRGSKDKFFVRSYFCFSCQCEWIFVFRFCVAWV